MQANRVLHNTMFSNKIYMQNSLGTCAIGVRACASARSYLWVWTSCMMHVFVYI